MTAADVGGWLGATDVVWSPFQSLDNGGASHFMLQLP